MNDEDLFELFDDIATVGDSVDTPSEPEPSSEAAADATHPPGEAGSASLDALAATLPKPWQAVVRAVLDALVADREAT